MSCPESVPIPSSKINVDVAECLAGFSPENYGLANYQLVLTSTVKGNVTTTSVLFLGGPRYTVTFFYNKVAHVVTFDRGILPSNAAAGRNTYAEEPTGWVLFRPLVAGSARPIQFLFDYFSVEDKIKVYAREQPPLSFSLPSPDSVPNITAEIIPTHDGKEINELIFRVTDFLPRGGTQVREYRQPVVRFTPVLCGCASSLKDRIAELGQGESFLQYMVLRYILSGFVSFERFDVNLLRQRYNCEFLASLEGTQYDVFLPILNANPSFASYFLC